MHHGSTKATDGSKGPPNPKDVGQEDLGGKEEKSIKEKGRRETRSANIPKRHVTAEHTPE